MATAIESGPNRHWSGSLLDLASVGLTSATTYEDETQQPCNILLKLGWPTKAVDPPKPRLCDNGSLLKEVASWRSRADVTHNPSGASDATVNSCGDAQFLLGLFKAIDGRDYTEPTPENSALQYSQVSSTTLPATEFDSACWGSCAGGHKPGLFSSDSRFPMANPDRFTKRFLRRHCHSESEVSAHADFGNNSLRNPFTQFVSLITLSSCLDTAGGKQTSFSTVDAHDPPRNDAAGDLTESKQPERDPTQKPVVFCCEPVQSDPNETPSSAEEQTAPNAPLPLMINDTPDSSFDEPLTSSRECLDYISSQDDASTNCSTSQTGHSPSSSLSIPSSSTRLTKSVSFADEIGKSLTEIFEFDASAEKVPDYQIDIYGEHLDRTLYGALRKSKLEEGFYPGRFTRSRARHRTYDYQADDRISSGCQDVGRYSDHSTRTVASAADQQIPVYVWNATFPQPATKYYEFRQKVENNAVSLESISVVNFDDQHLPNLSGTIKVLNLAFQKQVWLRITADNWRTFTEHQATYSQLLSGGHLQTPTRFDTFTFQIPFSSLSESLVSADRRDEICKLEFAIRYAVENGNKQYWDNNDGKNYTIERSQEMTNLSATAGTNLGSQYAHHSSPSARRDGTTSFCFSDYHTTVEDVRDPYTSEYLPNFSGITSFTNYRVWNHFVDETVYY